MSWHVRIKVVTKRYLDGWKLVVDELTDGFKDNVARGGGLDFPGIEKRLYDVPDEVRELVEVKNGDEPIPNWEYHDANTLGEIENRFRTKYINVAAELKNVERYATSPEYWRISEKEKTNVQKHLNELRGELEYQDGLWNDAKTLLSIVNLFCGEETYLAITGEG